MKHDKTHNELRNWSSNREGECVSAEQFTLCVLLHNTFLLPSAQINTHSEPSTPSVKEHVNTH